MPKAEMYWIKCLTKEHREVLLIDVALVEEL